MRRFLATGLVALLGYSCPLGAPAYARSADADVVTAEVSVPPTPEEEARYAVQRDWVEKTVRKSKRDGAYAIVVNKETHVLTLYLAGKPLQEFRVAIGSGGLEDKLYEGDARTPEGRYKVTKKAKEGTRNDTKYFRGLHLDYPNDQDRKEYSRLVEAGVAPEGVGAGGLIMIHGQGPSADFEPDFKWEHDWTMGCVALSNKEIAFLYDRVPAGTPVTIVRYPGR